MNANPRIIVPLVAALGTALFCGAVTQLAPPEAQLHQFLFERSPIQYLTLFLCAVSLTLLAGRWIEWRRGQRTLKAARANLTGWTERGGLTAGHFTAVHERLVQAGGGAALAKWRDLVEEQRAAIRKGYDPIHYLVGLLPLCGLFGTLLGLTRSLFAGFSESLGTDAVPRFVQALATSLDTTVLGLVCAMLAGSLAWFTERRESELLDESTAWVKDKLELEKLAAIGPGAGQAVEPSSGLVPATAVLAAELRVLTTRIADDAHAALQQMLRDTAEEHRRTIRQSIGVAIRQQRARDAVLVRRLTGRLGDCLEDGLKQIGALLERQNASTSRDLGRQLRRVAGALEKRTPDEVIVRYARNGHSRLEVDDVTA